MFSDKLLHVCTTLSNREAMAEQPWAQIESCLAALEAGLGELRGMQKSIERHTRRQLAATTLKENFSVLFDQFAERIGRNCYAQLVHARLPTRLSEARRALEELGQAGPLTIMQTEVMRRETTLAPEAAMARDAVASRRPVAVAGAGGTVGRCDRPADGGVYATLPCAIPVPSGNHQRESGNGSGFFEALNRRFAGRRMTELEDLATEVPSLRLVDIRLAGGLESLFTPRLRRAAGELEALDDPDVTRQDRALAQLEGTMRESLTVGRANQFVFRLPAGPGEGVSSEEVLRDHVHNDEDMASLIACLLHARSADARFRSWCPGGFGFRGPRFDSKLGYRVERFSW